MSRIRLDAQEVCHSFAAAAWRNFIILEWRQVITLHAVQQFEHFNESVNAAVEVATVPARRGLLVIVPPIAAAPEPAVRAAMAAGMKRNGDLTRSISMVYEADGLQATILRTIAAAITLMARQRAPTRVFRTLREAATWQAGQHAAPELADELHEAACLVRAL